MNLHMKPSLFFSMLGLSVALSCSQQSPIEDSVPIVYFDEFSDISPAEIIETSFLKLATTDGSLISSLSQIHSTKDWVLILDNSSVLANNRALAFDKKGAFITQIGQQGEGPR
ncbi:hypothetical protein AGMMS49525_15000 [Bacteroidia bacterium]|nr:hypothetical protein AGMMS49525_15000 [Bacteroidia bacterium]